MTNIDKKTKPNYINIVIDNNPAYLKVLKDQAKEDDLNDDGKTKLSLTTDKHHFDMEEYYFDDYDNSISISGNMISDKGESYVSISIPLSDKVLLDILEHSMKKLNKLKIAMEALK